MIHLKFLLLLSIIMIASACAMEEDVQIDACPDEFIGSVQLLSTSALPYLDTPFDSKITFTNENGVKIKYDKNVFGSRNYSTSIPKFCPIDQTFRSSFNYDGELISMNIQSLDNPVQFYFNLSTFIGSNDPVKENVIDELSITAYVPGSGPPSFTVALRLVVDQRASSSNVVHSEFFESIELINKTFTNVYKTNLEDPSSLIYYSLEEGIVAFTDFDEVQWVLDSFD